MLQFLKTHAFVIIILFAFNMFGLWIFLTKSIPAVGLQVFIDDWFIYLLGWVGFNLYPILIYVLGYSFVEWSEDNG